MREPKWKWNGGWGREVPALLGGAGVAVALLAALGPAGAGWLRVTPATAGLLSLCGLAAATARRYWGRALAAAVAVAGLGGMWLLAPARAPWPGAAAAPATALCAGLLGLGLLLKPAWERTAAGLDLFVGFTAYLALLSRALGAPAARNGTAMNLSSAAALLAITAAAMAAYPRLRPGAYFYETSSAAKLMRRLLPLTLLFPTVLAGVEFAGRQHWTGVSRWGGLAFLLAVIAFWAALLWLLGHTLDRLDDEHRNAEADLRASEERYRLLLESTSEGIYTVNLDGTLQWCNPAALEALGFDSMHAILGRNMHDLVHHTRADGGHYPAEECEMLLAARKGEAVRQDDELMFRADGSQFRADYRSDIVWRGGKPEAVVISFNDVTRKKAVEDQTRQAQKMEAVGRLAAGIAHDFNNLLTVINGYSEMVLQQELPARSRPKLEQVLKAGEKAAALTHQLLAFSRQQVLKPARMDLNAVVADMDTMLQRIIGEHVHLEMSLAPDLNAIEADAHQLGQVLMNLVINARDAMPEGGKLTVETANSELSDVYATSHPWVAPGPYVMMAVTDTGVGMSAETKAHIFEPFFTTKSAGKGTGLGMATVFGIVKQSGGYVSVYSEEGHGTTVKVYLPSRPESAAAAAPPKTVHEMAASRGRKTVLLVEDQEDLGRFAQEALEDAGYGVLRASDPAKALVLAAQHRGPIDLLITDMVMPGMTGQEIGARIVAQRPEIEVLYISGYPNRAIVRSGALQPDLAFLQKPFTADALLAKVGAVLQGKAAAAAAS